MFTVDLWNLTRKYELDEFFFKILFQKASENKPCVILIENIEMLSSDSNRDSLRAECLRRLKIEFLIGMDSVNEK
jgi:AAA+ superfamily predicted ATPase